MMALLFRGHCLAGCSGALLYLKPEERKHKIEKGA